MTAPQTHETPAGTGVSKSNEAGGFDTKASPAVERMQPRHHVGSASAQPLLDRLDRVRKSGDGWMARCPAHDDKTASLSITERDGKVLVHCFACCRTEDVLAAVGLRFKDLYPPRWWPESPEARREQRRVERQRAFERSLAVLPMEAKIVQLAARTIIEGGELDWEDYARLAQAVDAIDLAADALIEARHKGVTNGKA